MKNHKKIKSNLSSKKADLVPRRRGQCGACGSMRTVNEYDGNGNKYYFCEDCHCLSSPP